MMASRSLVLVLVAGLCSEALCFVGPTVSLPSLRGARVTAGAGVCTLKADMADDEAMAERMMDNLQGHMDAVKGLEAGPPSEDKFLGSKRLNKLKTKMLGGEEEDEHNLAMGFDHLINELKGLMGTEGFSGEGAQDAMRAANSVNSEIHEGDDVEDLAQDEARLLGSRRLYKLVKKNEVTASRGMKRKDHPGESIQQGYHGR